VRIGGKHDLRTLADDLLDRAVGEQTVFLGRALDLVAQTEREQRLTRGNVGNALFEQEAQQLLLAGGPNGIVESACLYEVKIFFIDDALVKIDDLARRMIQLAGFTPDKDIKIEYSGLRPGEKLYEEVLSNSENTIPTDHNRIRIAKVREYEYAEALAGVDELERLSRAVEIPTMVKLMKEIVPEFISKNSRFAEFDKK
jgi:FlaA1/EpsC-like NDP-sugar epimerase